MWYICCFFFAFNDFYWRFVESYIRFNDLLTKMVFMLPTLVAFFSSTDNPRAWLDQSSGLDPQAQRTNLVSGTQGRKIIKQFITEDVFQPFVETSVAIYIFCPTCPWPSPCMFFLTLYWSCPPWSCSSPRPAPSVCSAVSWVFCATF